MRKSLQETSAVVHVSRMEADPSRSACQDPRVVEEAAIVLEEVYKAELKHITLELSMSIVVSVYSGHTEVLGRG